MEADVDGDHALTDHVAGHEPRLTGGDDQDVGLAGGLGQPIDAAVRLWVAITVA